MFDADILPRLAAALLIDAVIGDPAFIYRVVPHPAVILGRCIGFLDRHLNRAGSGVAVKIFLGAVSVVGLAGVSWWLGYELAALLSRLPFGWALEALILSTLIAQNSLYRHVRRVAVALEDGGIEAGRDAVALVVGRDPKRLDQHGVSRAAIESLAENYSDAVVAPVFWAVLFGLPGMLAYKALNTADSMIGHRSARHLYFGKAAARLDDLANYIPARIAALFLAAAALSRSEHGAIEAARTALRDGARHRSVNAGYPEAAIAGALGLKLSGPRAYGGQHNSNKLRDEPWIGAGRTDAEPADIGAGLRLYVNACLLLGAIMVVAALLTAA
ncbi:MAG: cobalamin biosynthesis protein CobD [Rhodospirillaceae bacterium]|jgi:adenosylcobinamide-phosphate synthase|nr:cobalamin biosynthesis protein CobD [Rhodospirillaceae bacterium]MDP6645610.1 adenosylcobinamide-phosphate synthase CbiB [Rhodospirillales bacterium]|tara:strand:- start:1807 stop:2796 length:990 start_codon:yes stop_codon:yes gene_type:complete